jgi:hypothetical protein
MKHLTKIAAAALAALTLNLSACVEEQTTRSDTAAMRDASSAAETACMVAVNDNYGGKVDNITVTSSEFSQANSVVMMQAGPETWKYLVANDGNVQELNVVATR